MIDIRQTEEYKTYLSSIGWQVKRIENTNYFIKRLPLIGSIMKIQRPEKINPTTIENLTKKYRVFQVILESKEQINLKGFHLSKSPYLPTKTLQIDLTKSKEQILNNLKNDAKYALHKTKEIIVKEETDLEEFRNTWLKAVGLKRYVPSLTHLQSLKKAFGKKASFLIDEENNAGAIFLIGEKIAYYWQAFTNKFGRKYLFQYKIVWEGISWAKENKAKVFDFEGIYDERFPNKSWLGFTHFKKSFGGKGIEYPGCFTKLRFPL
jgi:lipid II:glycine glycyltransferase (peptidoglycan interpeptide bridge formation enzyme)